MRHALADLRFALRALLGTPIVFAASVLTLALGTGLATGVFAVAYGVLLRPLPYAEPDRLIVITPFIRDGRGEGVPLTEFAEWQRRLRSFEAVAGYATGSFTLRGAGDPRSVRGAMVTPAFFDVLGAPPREGSTRQFPADHGGAVLGSRIVDQIGHDGAWRQRGLTVGSSDFGAIAVLGPAFEFPDARTDVWVRADDVPAVTLFSVQDQRRFTIFGRLTPGVTLEQARDDARRVVREIEELKPAADRRQRDARVEPLDASVRRGAREAVLPFVFGAVLVLLVACANVSGLLVGRAIARQREFAVRRALGGGVAHLLRASLAESVAVTAIGWIGGLWIAWFVVRLFESRAAAAIPNLRSVHLDAPVVLGSFELAILVALVSGAAPALRAVRANPNTALKQSSERIGRAGRAFRGGLVIAQIAATIVLLVAAGLLTRTIARIVAAERGFEAANATAMRLMLTETVRFNATERAPFIQQLVEQARVLPGVVAAGVGSDLPPGNNQLTMTIGLIDRARGINERYDFGWAAATPGYLEAIGATLVKGRMFEDRDRGVLTPALVVSESAARAMFRDRDAVGREWPAAIPSGGGKRIRPRVIGVVRDVKYGGLDRSTPALTLFCQWEHLAPGNAHLVVRTSGPSASIAPALRRLVQQIDPSLPLATPQTLDEVVSTAIGERRLRLQLATAFAALALALAAIALWGAVAQNVLDRRHELAVRLALGATAGNAVGLMLRGGLVLIAIGVAIGGLASAAAARAIRHLFFGVSPIDPIIFAAGVGIAALVSVVACYVPARRAAAISPAELLRQT
jgi:putative ABC transport system permease protein